MKVKYTRSTPNGDSFSNTDYTAEVEQLQALLPINVAPAVPGGAVACLPPWCIGQPAVLWKGAKSVLLTEKLSMVDVRALAPSHVTMLWRPTDGAPAFNLPGQRFWSHPESDGLFVTTDDVDELDGHCCELSHEEYMAEVVARRGTVE